MKKVFASLLMIAATVSAFAIDYTAKATLTLKNNNGDECKVTIAQVEDAATAKTLCAQMNMDYRDIAFYVIDNDKKKYEIYATTDLADLKFGLMVNDAEDYTLTATDVVGTIYFFDAQTKKTVALENNKVIKFKATANTDVRFSITKDAPSTVPQICHQNGRLEISNYVGWNVEVVNYETGDDALNGAVTIAEDYQDIPLDIEEGQYKVKLTKDGEDPKELVIKVVK